MITETLNGKQWSAPDEHATEYEVAAFIGALVRLVKPSLAIETGCYHGQTSRRIAEALGGLDELWTCDTEEAYCGRTWDVSGVRASVNVTHRTGVAMIASMDKPIDFAFLDSGGDRLEEAQALLPKLSAGAYVVIHDSRRPNEQAALAYLQEHAKTETLTFDTPRGCVVVRVWR